MEKALKIFKKCIDKGASNIIVLTYIHRFNFKTERFIISLPGKHLQSPLPGGMNKAGNKLLHIFMCNDFRLTNKQEMCVVNAYYEKFELLTIKEVCNLLKMKESNIRNAIFKREIPHLKIGALIRFRKNELLKWLDGKSILPRD